MFIKEVIIYSLLTTIVLIIAYLSNVLLEMLLFIAYYYIIKSLFVKQFHADTVVKRPAIAVLLCYCITFVIQLIFVFIISQFNKSFYINIVIGVVLGTISFVIQDYLELKYPKATFYKGMKEDDLPSDLKGIEYDIIYKYYIKREKLDKIAISLNYSVETIKRIKSKVIKRYS